MSLRGYSLALVKANQAADQDLIGVRFGKYCIDKNISVSVVAHSFNVSRQTVYSWFIGTYSPRKNALSEIENILGQAKR